MEHFRHGSYDFFSVFALCAHDVTQQLPAVSTSILLLNRVCAPLDAQKKREKMPETCQRTERKEFDPSPNHPGG